MLFALNETGERVTASKGAAGICPGCQTPVRAKCGSIVTHHWAHVAKDCDPWSEPESEWHLGWKSLFPKECCEVVMGPHRADVRINGTVIEFQKSPISPEEIREREEFYGNMIWVLDGSAFRKRFHIRNSLQSKNFHWKSARKSWAAARKPVLIDFGGDFASELFHVTNWANGTRDGFGVFYEKSRFVRGFEVAIEFDTDVGRLHNCPICMAEYSIYRELSVVKTGTTRDLNWFADLVTAHLNMAFRFFEDCPHIRTMEDAVAISLRAIPKQLLDQIAETFFTFSFDDDMSQELCDEGVASAVKRTCVAIEVARRINVYRSTYLGGWKRSACHGHEHKIRRRLEDSGLVERFHVNSIYMDKSRYSVRFGRAGGGKNFVVKSSHAKYDPLKPFSREALVVGEHLYFL